MIKEKAQNERIVEDNPCDFFDFQELPNVYGGYMFILED
jgi:hypothetical protein